MGEKPNKTCQRDELSDFDKIETVFDLRDLFRLQRPVQTHGFELRWEGGKKFFLPSLDRLLQLREYTNKKNSTCCNKH